MNDVTFSNDKYEINVYINIFYEIGCFEILGTLKALKLESHGGQCTKKI